MPVYNKLVFTKHALQRMKERKATEHMVLDTFQSADSVHEGKKTGTKEFRKRFNNNLATLVATQNELGEWIALSFWIDPPIPGTKDYKQKQRYLVYKKAGFWKKLWLTLITQLGF